MAKYKLIINLKTYEQATDKKAIKLAKICKELEEDAKKKNVDIILSPQLIDIKEIINLGVKVYSQSIDAFEYGAHTGYTIPHVLKKLKVKGSIINHSEHTFKLSEIDLRIKAAKAQKLVTCVCARTLNDVKKISKLNPDMIAVEPAELIGGDISISTAKPKLISDSVKAANGISLLVGAGVKNADDVKKAVQLGAKGILVASGVVKAKSPKKAILDLLKGFD